MLKRGGSINEASIEKDPARGLVSEGPVGDDSSIARRAKVTTSTHGNALPPCFISSETIRRPGSSMLTNPRCRSSPTNVDLPPPEQPKL
jgi:hypothetical protein